MYGCFSPQTVDAYFASSKETPQEISRDDGDESNRRIDVTQTSDSFEIKTLRNSELLSSLHLKTIRNRVTFKKKRVSVFEWVRRGRYNRLTRKEHVRESKR